MSDSNENGERAQDVPEAVAGEDLRRPYEPPKLVKKRAVAKATLFTAMGPAMTGLTTMG
jgi:hypothetical protein